MFTTNSTWTDLGLNLDFCDEKPVTSMFIAGAFLNKEWHMELTHESFWDARKETEKLPGINHFTVVKMCVSFAPVYQDRGNTEIFCLTHYEHFVIVHFSCREELVNMYNVTLKFVSTQSGLTRWLHLQEHAKSEEDAL